MKRFLAFWDEEGGMGYQELREDEVSSMAQYHNAQQHAVAAESLSAWASKAELGDEYREMDSRGIIIRVKDFGPEPTKPGISATELASRAKQSKKNKRQQAKRLALAKS